MWQSAASCEEKHWQQVKAGDLSPLPSNEDTEFGVLWLIWAPQCNSDMDTLEGVQQ